MVLLEGYTRSNRTGVYDDLVLLPELINICKVPVLEVLLGHIFVFQESVLAMVVDNLDAFLFQEAPHEFSELIGRDHSIDVLRLPIALSSPEEQLCDVVGVDLSVGVDLHLIITPGFEGIHYDADIIGSSQCADILNRPRFHQAVHHDH